MSKENKSSKKKKSSAATEAKAERSETSEHAPSMSRSSSQASVASCSLSDMALKIVSMESKDALLEMYEEQYGPTNVTIDDTDYLISEGYKLYAAYSYNIAKSGIMGTPNTQVPTMHEIIMRLNQSHPIKDECIAIDTDIDTADRLTSPTNCKRKADDSESESVASQNIDGTTSVGDENEQVEVPDKEVTEIRKLKPKPIMVKGIAADKLKQFAELLIKNGNPGFQLKTAGIYVRVYPDTHADKLKIIEILKTLNIQFYIVPDRTPLYKQS